MTWQARYDMASTIHQSINHFELMDSIRLVIKHFMKRSFIELSCLL